jgi:hypothetical protein
MMFRIYVTFVSSYLISLRKTICHTVAIIYENFGSIIHESKKRDPVVTYLQRKKSFLLVMEQHVLYVFLFILQECREVEAVFRQVCKKAHHYYRLPVH